jgi:hypothetical protein
MKCKVLARFLVAQERLAIFMSVELNLWVI